MFSNELVNFLKSLSKLSNSVILKSPITTGKSEANDVAFKFDVQKVGNHPEDDFGDIQIGLFDLSAFLNVLGLFGDASNREVEIENSNIKIFNDVSKANYIMTEPEILSNYVADPAQIDKSMQFPTIAEFSLSVDDIKRLRTSSVAFKDLDLIRISAEDEIEISLTTSGKFTKTSNSYTIRKSCQPQKIFNVKLGLETFMRLPMHDYTVQIKYNETRNAYRILLLSKTVEGFVMQVSVKIIDNF